MNQSQEEEINFFKSAKKTIDQKNEKKKFNFSVKKVFSGIFFAWFTIGSIMLFLKINESGFFKNLSTTQSIIYSLGVVFLLYIIIKLVKKK